MPIPLRTSTWLRPVLMLAPLAATPALGNAGDVAASAPIDLSVTVYRNPWRSAGSSLDLDGLGGFALITETRTIHLPAGRTRLRFAGVADGIQPETALITGLPDGVLEKNRDAKVLSPAALVAETVGRTVEWVRRNPKTGAVTRTPGTLLSDAEGVVFKSAAGVEALRCSGLPETFEFAPTTTTAATPTLSAIVRASAPTTVQVKLSYLATGFDWMANYVATVTPDGKTLDLGAWVTLANGNAVSFGEARTQVVAGRLNRETEQVEPVDWGGPVLASCWPRGSTSDTPMPPPENSQILLTGGLQRAMDAPVPMAMAALQEVVAAKAVKQEDLGDLKLYRVPERTSVASRQSKQVRLLDRHEIPVELLYRAEIDANDSTDSEPLQKLLRTRNDARHHLGLPLPAGQVAAFMDHAQAPLFVDETPMRDTAIDEELEIGLGASPDVRLRATEEQETLRRSEDLPLIPGVVHLHSATLDAVNRVELSNAREHPATVEVALGLPDGLQLIRASQVPKRRKGRLTFTVTVPANGTATLRYQTEHTSIRPQPR